MTQPANASDVVRDPAAPSGMRLVILGPPGAGKGTQASRIAGRLGVPAISTGDIFRTNIKNETDLGRQVKDILASGGYVSDEVTNAIVDDRLEQDDCVPGFLLDGYPRTMAQVAALDDILANRNARLDKALELTRIRSGVLELDGPVGICRILNVSSPTTIVWPVFGPPLCN